MADIHNDAMVKPMRAMGDVTEDRMLKGGAHVSEELLVQMSSAFGLDVVRVGTDQLLGMRLQAGEREIATEMGHETLHVLGIYIHERDVVDDVVNVVVDDVDDDANSRTLAMTSGSGNRDGSPCKSYHIISILSE